MGNQNGEAQNPASTRLADSGETPPGQGKNDVQNAEDDVEGGDLEAVLKQWANILGAPTVVRAIECWAQRIAAEPERARLDHELRMQAHRDSARYYQTNRWFFLAALGLCLGFLGGVIWLLKDNKDILLPVLTAVIGLLAGAGGGWVFGQRPIAKEP